MPRTRLHNSAARTLKRLRADAHLPRHKAQTRIPIRFAIIYRSKCVSIKAVLLFQIDPATTTSRSDAKSPSNLTRTPENDQILKRGSSLLDQFSVGDAKRISQLSNTPAAIDPIDAFPGTISTTNKHLNRITINTTLALPVLGENERKHTRQTTLHRIVPYLFPFRVLLVQR